MHLSKVMFWGGLVVTTTITKTIYTTTFASPSSVKLETSSTNAELPAGSSIEPTATLTSFQTHTDVVSIVPAVATSVKANQGPYSFAEHSGTTVWLGGKKPPASGSAIVLTKAITVLPVPPSAHVVPDPENSLTESYTTLHLTRTTSKVFTETLTESSSTSAAAAKPFTGIATYGWNSSLTTLLTVPSGAKESGRARSIGHPAYRTGHNKPLPNITYPFLGPQVTGKESASLAERQVGAIVVATIEGHVVSWTNSYDGQRLASTSEVTHISRTAVQATAAAHPTTTLAAYPWDLSPFPSPVHTIVPTVSVKASPSTSSSTTVSPSTRSLLVPSIQFEPGIPTLQPTFTASLVGTVPHATHHTSGITPSAAFSNTSSASSTPAAPTSKCSGSARFTIGFDDLPHFSTGPNDVDVPPIFNPYRKLYWEEHFGYVPPPTDPYLPISPPQLAIYRVDNNTDVDASPDAGDESIGEFGAGPRSSESAYWIDAFSAHLGCLNAGPENCIITINGYDAISSTRTVFQTVTQPPCPGLRNCKFTQVQFDAGFRNLSGIQILAAVNDRPVTWYMDDLQLGWSNNTCAAATERASAEYPRFFNSTLTRQPVLTTSSQSAIATPPARNRVLTASGQVGSVPAFGDGPGAATTVIATSSPATTQNIQTHQPMISQSLSKILSQRSSITVQPRSTSAQMPRAVNSTAASRSSILGSASSSKPRSPPQGSVATNPSSPALTKTPNANNGNTAMALGFNSVFAGMTTESSCDETNPNEAVACINGQYARCGIDGKYALAECPSGQQCFALPLPKGAQGITVQCADMKAASQILGQGSTSSSATQSPAAVPKPQQSTDPSQPKPTIVTTTKTKSEPTNRPDGSLSAQSAKHTESPNPKNPFPKGANTTSTSSSASVTDAPSPKHTESPNPQGSPRKSPTTTTTPTSASATDGPIIISIPNSTPSSRSDNAQSQARVAHDAVLPAQPTKTGAVQATQVFSRIPDTTLAPVGGSIGQATVTVTVTKTAC
ncbi:MAG: hypothetical protein Q9191_002407 [Dirinaria sp. TL-2023a]